MKTYKAGTYKVGSDISAGEYKLTATSSGYYCVYPDSSKSSILENDNFTVVDYITVEDGQYLVVKDATFVAIADATPTSTLKSSGVYKVGYDCAAGEYKITQVGSTLAYYCVYDNSTVDRDIVDNDNFENSDYVTVEDGEYLVINRATAELS